MSLKIDRLEARIEHGKPVVGENMFRKRLFKS